MLTKNFKNLMAMVLERISSNYVGLLEVRSTSNTVFYLTGYYDTASYPYAVAQGVVTSVGAAGILLGSGDIAATEDDYTLQAPITGDMTAVISTTTGLDNGSPYIEFNLVVTNTGANTLTIREIGYIQQLYTSTAYGSNTSGGRRYFLLDRTVLETPAVILAGENGVVKYRLKTTAA